MIKRAESWPEAAREKLAAVAREIESELQANRYHASDEELRIIDAAAATLDAGEQATDDKIRTAFAKAPC
ncbi:hypothetical protein [Rhodopseudomonas palustris]|uniref:Uncharacterized protein n=1 Tax=Rhodopseudomonas palustris (strain ATCC BAA-98 / CGA009) TaxID=258594 RepID=A0AAE9Y990_RHOPA|nr:hypothetical protein [Rhodopseudomonas palustris]WAB77096.1 hypothetical protein OR798_21805 [Rhodopseudomonas palustris]WCL94395.1 hypothetical protein TX73_021800 [Rhodopseudomonas palustris CGA009]